MRERMGEDDQTMEEEVLSAEDSPSPSPSPSSSPSPRQFGAEQFILLN